IIFDSVSRMSRSADEGVEIYFELYEKGIQLIFLKERYIDTAVYSENLKDKIELQGTDEDEIFKGLNNYFRKLAERQIRIAFEQAEKEVEDLHQRTREGIETARLNGKQIGQCPGSTLHVKKKLPVMEIIKKHSRDFGGSLSDLECMELAKVSRNTFYKYKKELRQRIME
ncbi:MAG: recombinase family protein, partial [Clostridiales bacterium]|nr:recombinase family protein [Clostridiales bacterium]